MIVSKVNQKSGFTLVELLTVIAIIGILAGVIMVSASRSRQVARDRRRVADLNLISSALQAYRRDGNVFLRPNQYGEGGTGSCPAAWDCSFADGNGNGIFFVDFLVPNYFDAPPVDPRHPNLANFYLYLARTANPGMVTDGCVQPFYTLIARLETGGLEAARNDQSCWTGLDAGLDTSYVLVGR